MSHASIRCFPGGKLPCSKVAADCVPWVLAYGACKPAKEMRRQKQAKINSPCHNILAEVGVLLLTGSGRSQARESQKCSWLQVVRASVSMHKHGSLICLAASMRCSAGTGLHFWICSKVEEKGIGKVEDMQVNPSGAKRTAGHSH